PRALTTMTTSNGVGRVRPALRRMASGPGILLAVVSLSLPALAAEPALMLHANAVAGADVPMTIELVRWSTDAERAPLLAALAPAPPPAAAPAADAGAAGRAGRAGGGGRGGRGGGGAAPANPLARLTTAVKTAPTLGFIWGT